MIFRKQVRFHRFLKSMTVGKTQTFSQIAGMISKTIVLQAKRIMPTQLLVARRTSFQKVIGFQIWTRKSLRTMRISVIGLMHKMELPTLKKLKLNRPRELSHLIYNTLINRRSKIGV